MLRVLVQPGVVFAPILAFGSRECKSQATADGSMLEDDKDYYPFSQANPAKPISPSAEKNTDVIHLQERPIFRKIIFDISL